MALGAEAWSLELGTWNLGRYWRQEKLSLDDPDEIPMGEQLQDERGSPRRREREGEKAPKAEKEVQKAQERSRSCCVRLVISYDFTT